jgi:hypothetical protein
MKRSWVPVVVAAVWLSSCTESPTQPPEPPPTGAPTATPTPGTPAAPTATPVPTVVEPPEDDNPGPVHAVGVRIFQASSAPLNQGGELRPGPYYDEATNQDVVYLGEFIIFDTTPKNSSDLKCCRGSNVSWHFENGTLFEHIVGSNKFQYRVFARRRGVAQVYTVIDGVRSQVTLNVQIR